MTVASRTTRRSIRFGSADIAYRLTVEPRRDMVVHVHPDLSVHVIAPDDRAPETIDQHVRKKAPWIIRHQMRFEDYHPLPVPRQFVSGESHRYLGRQYRLKVVKAERRHVALRRPFLVVEVLPGDGAEAVGRLVGNWYRERAEAVLPVYAHRFMEAHPSLRAPISVFRVRRMARRWGSCAPSGKITLNPELVRAPSSCIEYVIAHELCHRKVLNHGPSFERLLAESVPNWRVRRQRLNKLD
ncbi:MAG: M48 family metallopeptidase [Phycisphaerales bacterium JB060]